VPNKSRPQKGTATPVHTAQVKIQSHISLDWFSCGSSIPVELEFGVFLRREENLTTRGKTLGAKTRTNNKLNPHMTKGWN